MRAAVELRAVFGRVYEFQRLSVDFAPGAEGKKLLQVMDDEDEVESVGKRGRI